MQQQRNMEQQAEASGNFNQVNQGTHQRNIINDYHRMLQADQESNDSPIKGNRQAIPIEQNFTQEESEDEELQNSESPQKLTNKLSKGN
jgi:hypothetical protein